MENYKLITEKKGVERLVDDIFSTPWNSRLVKGLTQLSNGNGYRKEYQSIEFKHELSEYELNMLQQPMPARHILVSASYPAAEEDCEAYISFEDFYKYLEKSIHQVLKRSAPEGFESLDKNEILQLLGEVKIALEI